MNKARHQLGFTLVEVMVAITIFSIIGLAGWSMLRSAATTSTQLEQASAELFDLQKGIWLISRDLQQLAGRSIRDGDGDTEKYITTQTPGRLLSFTRTRESLLPENPEIQLVRIDYRLEPENSSESSILFRDVWPVLDRDSSSQPQTQQVLKGVSQVDVRIIGATSQSRTYGTSPDENLAQVEPLPSAIQIRLETVHHGVIERLIPLTAAGDSP